jgi:four helix bundle protein
MAARHLHDLAAFRLCEELMKRVEAETAKDPLARHFRFCDQLNDAALDAASDVAEGFVRYYPGEFARFLDYAISSLQEVQTRTEAAYRRTLLSAVATSDILNLCIRADTACRNLRAYLWKVRKEDLPPRPQRERPPLPKRRTPRPTRNSDRRS